MRFRSILSVSVLLTTAFGFDDELEPVRIRTPRLTGIAAPISLPIDRPVDTTQNQDREAQLIVLRDVFDSHAAVSGSGFLDWFMEDRAGKVDTEVCYFEGVICDSADQVIALDLNSTGLSGTLPSSLGRLSYLRRLKVYNNSLIGEIPRSLSLLTHLRQVNLGRNNLDGPIPDFTPLIRLRHVMLQHNDLSGMIAQSLCRLEHITALDLSENRKLHGELPTCFGNLPHLKVLRIRNLGLTGHLPSSLCLERDFNDLVPNKFGCDGLACGTGFFEPQYGRQVDDSSPCLPCDISSNVIGSTTCHVVSTDVQSIAPTFITSSEPSWSLENATLSTPSVSPTGVGSTGPSGTSDNAALFFPSSTPSDLNSAVPSLVSTEFSSTPTTIVLPTPAPSQNLSVVPSHSPTNREPSTPLPHSSGSPSLNESPSIEPSSATKSSVPSLGPPSTEAPTLGSSVDGVSLSPSVVRSDTTAPFSTQPGNTSTPTFTQVNSIIPTSPSAASASPTAELHAYGIEDQTVPESIRSDDGNRVIIPIVVIVFCFVSFVVISVSRRTRANHESSDSSIADFDTGTDQSSVTIDPYGVSRRDGGDEILRVRVWDENGNDNMESDMEMTLDTEGSDSRSFQSSQHTDGFLRYDFSQCESHAASPEDLASVASSSNSTYNSASPMLPPIAPPATTPQSLSSFLQPSQWIKSIRIQSMDCGLFGGTELLQTVASERSPSNACDGVPATGLDDRMNSIVSDTSSIGSLVPILKPSQESSSASTPQTSNQSLGEEKYHRHLVSGEATGARPALFPPKQQPQSIPQGHVGQVAGVVPFRRRKWLPVGAHDAYK